MVRVARRRHEPPRPRREEDPEGDSGEHCAHVRTLCRAAVRRGLLEPDAMYIVF